ncbi:MAG: hypothetical protein MNPFHGCM_02067 [Gemmatimonadaceae bacterium]|nr:hypothetical protein [Gemmatimonadaceae bacterium]
MTFFRRFRIPLPLDTPFRNRGRVPGTHQLKCGYASGRHRSTLALLSAGILAAAACGKDVSPATSPQPAPPGNTYVVTLTPAVDTLHVGFASTLEARVTDRAGVAQNVDVTWMSLRPELASVTQGIVTAVAAGTADIVARFGTAADTAHVVVLADPVQLQILPTAVNGLSGDTVAFRARLIADTGATQDARSVQWSATDTAAVALVSDGKVELRGAGDAEVVATVGQLSARASVSVFTARIGSIAIDPPNSTLRTGASLRLTARLRDETGRPMKAVTARWASSDDAIATVDADGSIHGVANGMAVISVVSGAKRATASVRVTSEPASSLAMSLPHDTIVPGYRERALAVPRDAEGQTIAGANILYASSNPAVARVTPSGVVIGIAPGQTTIAASCDDQVATVSLMVEERRVSGLDIVPAGAFLPMGSAATLRAEVRDQVGQSMPAAPVTWTALSPGVLTVTPSGIATGVALGMGTVVASSGGRTRQAGVMVTSYAVGSVRVSPAAVTVAVGRTVALSAIGYHPSGSALEGTIFDWDIADSSIAVVSSSGMVTGMAKGSTTVTVTSGSHSASTVVTVVDAPPARAAKATLSVNAPTLDLGQTTQAVVTLLDADGNPVADRPVAWVTDQPDVATVSADGVIAAVAPGSATISATADGVVSLTTVTIATPPREPVAAVTVSAPSRVLSAGRRAQLTTVLADAQGRPLKGRSLSFASSNPSTLTVSAAGLVHAMAPGLATVSVTCEGVTGDLSFTVLAGPPPPPAVHTLAVTLNASALRPGQFTQGTAVATDSTGGPIPGIAYSWASSNDSVASVNSDGLVSALAPGAVTISASAGGKTGAADLVVTAVPPAVASIIVSLVSDTLAVGERQQASAVARDAQGNAVVGVPLSWSVSSTSILAVSANGEVTALAEGTADVEATAGGVTGRSTVIVTSPPPDDGPSGLIAPAALPQVYLDFPYAPPTGRTIAVATGGKLQDALNTAKRGDEIVLPAGATFIGNFSLPAKPGSASDGWITIRSDKLSQLPVEGTRVTPALASLMPKLVTPNSAPALGTQLGASGYRIVGVEFTVAPSFNGPQYGIVWLGDGSSAQNDVARIATDLVLDRVYIHGQTTTDTRRCVSLNSARTQISDSYLSECHSKGTDSQAIQGHNGPGPYKIVNNTLIAATENITFGGGDPWIPGMIPSDIEIRRNYFYTPIAWKGKWLRKNLFELKAGRRILVEGNVFDGSWTDGQTGWAFMLKSENQSGGCTWCTVSDITIRYNYIRNAGAGFAINGRYGNHPVGALAARFTVQHNVLENINVDPFAGDARFVQVLANAQDVDISYNTMTSTGRIEQFLLFDLYPSATRVAFNRNATTVGKYGLFANSRGEGAPALGAVAGGWEFKSNYLIGSARTGYPAGTSWASSLAGVPRGFGADQAALNTRIVGVEIP